MADGNTKSYPKIPNRIWWGLRKKAQGSVPKSFTASYLATACDITEPSAKTYLLPFRSIGFVDDSGKPTDRFESWRHDDHYGKVCDDILEEIYPDELRSALPPPSPDREQVVKWFGASLSHVGSQA